jgi:hypothetical protein
MNIAFTVLAALAQDKIETGIAAGHPGDRDLGKHPAVLFHDDFESGAPGERWDLVRTVGKSEHPPVTAEKDPAIARGAVSARATLRKGGFSDIGLCKRLTPGQDELFMRHYIRYGRDYGFHSHGGSGFCASSQPTGFGPGGHAGRAPAGDKFFWSTLEPIGRASSEKAPGPLIFYTYWWKMKPDGKGNHWGNWFRPEADQVPALETWTCVEWRVKANAAGQEDGELDCWIDGVRRGSFRNINWRSTDALKVNQVSLSQWLEERGYAGSGGGETRTVWYDDVVVATKYVGPKERSQK